MVTTPRSRAPKRLTLARLRKLGAQPDCPHYQTTAQLYPRGVPCTYADALALHEAGVDVLYIALRLLDQAGRTAFILYTLRQRQPHLVTLFARAGLPEHAEAIRALSFATAADAEAAGPVLAAARGAARGAAWAAAWAAARGAARDAARDAAWDAARDAAWGAAWAAAWAAARADQLAWIARYLNLPDAPPDPEQGSEEAAS